MDSLPMYLTGASNQYVRAIARQAGIGLLVRPGNSYLTHAEHYAAWAADNGQYTTKPGSAPTDEEWFAWLQQAVEVAGADGCLFATAPDVLKVIEVDGKPVVIGDAQATLERSRPWLARIRELGVPAALVAQDGVEELEIPWGEFDVLFLGGSTEWKVGPAAEALTREAKARGVRVHMGRVNSGRRLKLAGSWGVDTADGTFLAFGPEKNLVRLLAWYGMTPEGLAPTPAPLSLVPTTQEESVMDTTDARELAAELEILTMFDAIRTARGHDYGGGQRRQELARRRRHFTERDLDRGEPTLDELRAAFERVGRPRLARLAVEGYRAHTPSSTRTRESWAELERRLESAARRVA